MGVILRGPNVPAGCTSAAQIPGPGHHRRCVRACERGTTCNTVAATAEASLPLSGRDRPGPDIRLNQERTFLRPAGSPRWARMAGTAGVAVTKAICRTSPPRETQERGHFVDA